MEKEQVLEDANKRAVMTFYNISEASQQKEVKNVDKKLSY
jgi:hypothetical protein